MKSKALLDSFTEYCQKHPEQRFWQALRNWCGWRFVFVSNTHDILDNSYDPIDTFYWEKNQLPD